MVFHCRCLSFKQDYEEIESETQTQTQTKSTETFYTTGSDFNRLVPNSHAVTSHVSNLGERTSKLRLFTLAELKAGTQNFHRARMIGEGGFGSVYKGVVNSLEHPFHEIQVAVKRAKRLLQGHKEWMTEINILGVLEHPNLVKLIGYCAEDDERGTHLFLVYEYMVNGSLSDIISAKSKTPLSWYMRLKVARDAARGLTYLHEQMDFQIILRDFKASNILLDDQWNAKLSDFGVARLGPEQGASHVSTAFVGTVGYAAPEYFADGQLTSKSDVWSYGVFLNELITGRRSLDRSRPQNEQRLQEWIQPYVGSKRFQKVIDPRLEGDYSLKSAQKLSFIASCCLHKDPKSRPKMSEVLEMVNQLIAAKNRKSSSSVSCFRKACGCCVSQRL